ncbi:hypothetical protein [Nocardia brasiliensis]|uniref:hypothetical protein n=1 Tax=Nocardia brasiliensis TaxID=37326 RepID=UPI000ADF02FC|nr:hypothetical protein [Nocardia brasiliensis]
MTGSPHGAGDRSAADGKPLLIVAGAVGAGLLLVIVVVIGFVASNRDRGGISGTPVPVPATYSVAATANACDLVDRAVLTKWAAAPRLEPDHTETRNSGRSGTLNCTLFYGNAPGDKFPMNTAALRVRADVVAGSGARTYEHCKRSTADLADTGSEVTSGEFTGIGTQGYWQFEADNFGGIVDAKFVVCVWEGEAAVKVDLALSREKAAPEIGRDELDSVARSQARKVLDGLRTTGASVPPSAAATSTPPSEPAPGNYAMSKAANACDLVDPTVLQRWSSTPDQPPSHRETQPSAHDPGSLTCQVSFKSLAGDGVQWNQAAIDLRVEFTAAGAAPAYDEWKRKDTTTTGSGLDSGDVPGIGARGYWHTAVSDSSSTTGMDYVVGVQDSNVSVRVRIPLLRQHGEPPVHLDEVGAVARNQAQRALDALRK